MLASLFEAFATSPHYPYCAGVNTIVTVFGITRLGVGADLSDQMAGTLIIGLSVRNLKNSLICLEKANISTICIDLTFRRIFKG